jgi:hypothetical protein
MRLVLAMLLLAARPALARPAQAGPAQAGLAQAGLAQAGPAQACADAAAAAERASGAPAGLLAAIGRVESGRRDPDGTVSAWPWTVNARGAGRAFGTLAEAAGFVRALQADGVRLIDAGCLQVDLLFHGAAFSSVEQAFDPAANADYAARLLTSLRERTGSWGAAVAAYHSGVPAEGEPYRRRVMAEWLGPAPGADPFEGRAPAWTGPGRTGPDPFVALMSASAASVRVLRLTPQGWRASPAR